MKSSRLNLRPLRTGLVVLAALAATGWALEPLEQPAWEAVRAREPALKLDTLQAALGQGITVGLLGGFRALVADFLWIKGEVLWEDRDLPATQSCLKLVTTIDPRPLFFWVNSARMITDMPNWRILAEGGYQNVPRRRQQVIVNEQAAVALKLLQDALTYHPNSWEIYLEMGNIHLYHTGDIAAGAAFYKLAALEPGAPGFAGRIHANLLEQIGRYQEAYDWRIQLYKKLPKPPARPDPAEAGNQAWAVQHQMEAEEVDEMLQRIRKLEQILHIPLEQTFRP